MADRRADRYQGIVIVPDVPEGAQFNGHYKAKYYCPEAGEDFRRDVEEKQTRRGERVQDSRWLDKPVSRKEITSIGRGMLKKMWGTR